MQIGKVKIDHYYCAKFDQSSGDEGDDDVEENSGQNEDESSVETTLWTDELTSKLLELVKKHSSRWKVVAKEINVDKIGKK